MAQSFSVNYFTYYLLREWFALLSITVSITLNNLDIFLLLEASVFIIKTTNVVHVFLNNLLRNEVLRFEQ